MCHTGVNNARIGHWACCMMWRLATNSQHWAVDTQLAVQLKLALLVDRLAVLQAVSVTAQLAVLAAHMSVWLLVDTPAQVLDTPGQVLDTPVLLLVPVALAWMHIRNFVLLQDLNNWLCRCQAIQTQAV